VNDSENCTFLTREKSPNSPHRKVEKACDDLMNQARHIEKNFMKFTSKQKEENQLCLKASIDVIKLLTFQGCAFKGHNETKS
jgi:hypothetical protein